jgi:broad specificity phosphatase PhoE
MNYSALILAAIVTVALAACSKEEETAAADPAATGYTLYLVRHAEKMDDGSDDPELSGAGHARAGRLAGWLEGRDIAAVWSSNFRRTMQTATPVAALLDVPLNRYDPADQPALARQLIAAGQSALVIGHSNTIPELAATLCGCDVAEMDESEYDRLVVVEMGDGAAQLMTLDQRALTAD